MKHFKSRKLSQLIIVITTFVMLVCLTACENSDNIESNNRYKLNVEEQTEDFYVNDFANIFSNEEKQVMMENALALANDYDGVQVVVSTVTNLNGNEIEEYAYSMYEQYGIGKDSMGILILLSVEDRSVKIETGKNMQAYITDSKSGQLLDKYGMDYFRENRFSEGLQAVQEAVISEIRDVVPIDWNVEQEKDETVVAEESEQVIETENNKASSSNNNNEIGGIIDMVFGCLFFVALVVIGVLISRYLKLKEHYTKIAEENKQLSNQNTQLSEKATSLNGELVKTRSKCKKNEEEFKGKIFSIVQKNETLSQQITDIQEFYGRVRKLHPECDFEKEVEAMKEAEFKKAVEEVNNQINVAIKVSADKDRVETFKNVINMYESAEDKIREAVTADINKVRKLYNESVELRNRAIAISEAEQLDKHFCSVLNLTADKENFNSFGSALKAYNEAGTLTRSFVKSDIAKIKKLYDESIRLKEEFEREQQEKRYRASAHDAEMSIHSTISSIYGTADEDDIDKINRAFRYYENLSSEERKYFDSELLAKMRRLKREADDDHEYQERRREERRRRESISHHSSSSFGGSSHHSGFGGHSSGGGATRHF